MDEQNKNNNQVGGVGNNAEGLKKSEASDVAERGAVNRSDEALAKCQALSEEYLNGWKRAKADFINYQKDEARRFEEIIEFGQKDLLKELLLVLDSFDLASVSTRADEVGKGWLLIRSQFLELLKKYGVERLAVKAGDKFDPVQHEAVGEVESDLPLGTVAREVGGGYRLHDRILRPTKVEIAKAKMVG